MFLNDAGETECGAPGRQKTVSTGHGLLRDRRAIIEQDLQEIDRMKWLMFAMFLVVAGCGNQKVALTPAQQQAVDLCVASISEPLAASIAEILEGNDGVLDDQARNLIRALDGAAGIAGEDDSALMMERLLKCIEAVYPGEPGRG